MTNRSRNRLACSMPLLTLACSRSALMHGRMARVNHLRAALPHIRHKAKTLRHSAQALLSRPNKALELGAGNEINDEYPGIAHLVGAGRPNSGGAK